MPGLRDRGAAGGAGEGGGVEVDDERAPGAAGGAVGGDEPVEVLGGGEHEREPRGGAEPLGERQLEVRLGERGAVVARRRSWMRVPSSRSTSTSRGRVGEQAPEGAGLAPVRAQVAAVEQPPPACLDE